MLKIKQLVLLNGKKIDFEANPGEIIWVKGENGSGKSLFLKSLARLIPASSQEISLNGKKNLDLSAPDWRASVLYLPPEVSFLENQTVLEFLKAPWQLERYKNFVPSFDPSLFVKDPHQLMSLLSSGQKQKLALLRALSLDYDVLLLDESFGHMDQITREEMLELILLARKNGKIFFLVSHFDLMLGQNDTREISI